MHNISFFLWTCAALSFSCYSIMAGIVQTDSKTSELSFCNPLLFGTHPCSQWLYRTIQWTFDTATLSFPLRCSDTYWSARTIVAALNPRLCVSWYIINVICDLTVAALVVVLMLCTHPRLALTQDRSTWTMYQRVWDSTEWTSRWVLTIWVNTIRENRRHYWFHRKYEN